VVLQVPKRQDEVILDHSSGFGEGVSTTVPRLVSFSKL
jgi:hypothetical protein